MPSGYAAAVQDNPNLTFREFAMSCARAFGALIEMRDDPMDAPIPEFKPSDYHARGLVAAKERLGVLQSLTKLEAGEQAVKEYNESMAAFTASEQSRAETRARYERMAASARAWTPPSPEHEGMKQFMLDQLKQSIEWDCGDHSQWRPTCKTSTEWLAENIEAAQRNIAYHEEKNAEEIARAKERNLWVKQLRESLA